MKVLGTSSLICLPSKSNELFKPGVAEEGLENITGEWLRKSSQESTLGH